MIDLLGRRRRRRLALLRPRLALLQLLDNVLSSLSDHALGAHVDVIEDLQEIFEFHPEDPIFCGRVLKHFSEPRVFLPELAPVTPALVPLVQPPRIPELDHTFERLAIWVQQLLCRAVLGCLDQLEKYYEIRVL